MTGFALDNLQQRGELFVEPGTEVYEGMVVGENVPPRRDGGQRRAGQGEEQHPHPQPRTRRQAPGARSTLETAIEWIADDELVEVTPKAIRIRKRHLNESDRRIAAKRTGR